MTDDLYWFNLLPETVKIALLVDPGGRLPPHLVTRLPRIFRAFYGTDDPATGGWALRPDLSQALRNGTEARGGDPLVRWTPLPAAIQRRQPPVFPTVNEVSEPHLLRDFAVSEQHNVGWCVRGSPAT
ncbi:hypothetical protein [Mycobacterium paraterrae]|uniref:Uncharacterized protein n=1 Tax=Mycobacterium paraterrae TaxID=577492 RepID=A0ABY3VL02_9MYCO|nr:hypothetical protein [Mycobacterium paraterrae]UMB70096.1 hypothetical protein MKK62_01735 [Mycobacterium paraterrae]